MSVNMADNTEGTLYRCTSDWYKSFLVRVSPFVSATDKDGGIMARLNDSNVAAATFEYAEVLRVIALDI